jgi:hypothetical protein
MFTKKIKGDNIMSFTIAKPKNYMSFGDLFYSKPQLGENEGLFEQLYQMCHEKADEAFPNYRSDPKQKKLIHLAVNELEMIEATGSAFAVLIMKEIADLSHEMGYPTELLGSESGLVLFSLLGITSINPCQFIDFAIPSKMFCEEAFDGFFKGSQRDGVSFTLAIAEPVREKIQQRLDQRFSHIATLNHTYASISLPDYGLLEKIGNYTKETGIDYQDIDLEDPDLLKAVCEEICQGEPKVTHNFDDPKSSLELARVCAYAHCCSETKDRFDVVKDFVFRDELYAVLRKTSLYPRDAIRLARNWSLGEKKDKDIETLRRYKVPPKQIEAYRELENQWPAAACLARVNGMLMLKYYERGQDSSSE